MIIIIIVFIYPRALIEESFWRARYRRFKIYQKLIKVKQKHMTLPIIVILVY